MEQCGVIEAVTKDRWLEAQAAEREVVHYDMQGAYNSTRHILDYLQAGLNHEGKVIAEIGCGPFPAVMFCQVGTAITFEPLFPFPEHCPINIYWNQEAFEDFKPQFFADEVWLFNVLQHVRDPEKVVSKAKETAPVVRFFEPVDYPTCVYHPHTFSQADFERWFPNSVKRYTDRVPQFFDDDCCYGTWKR